MEKVIVDIGSGRTKSYIINEKNQILKLYAKRIPLRERYNELTGINKEDKKCLFDTINKIKHLSEGRPIHIYGTSVFRTMEDKISLFLKEFEKNTNLKIEVISVERESELMTKAVGNLGLDDTYLVVCVGNGATEINVMKDGQVIESVDTEFARANLVNSFPELRDEECNTPITEMEEFVGKNLKLPKIKSDNIIVLGFNNLDKTMEFGFELSNNTYFHKQSIPSFISKEQFQAETKRVLNENCSGSYLYLFRANCIIIGYILKKMGAKVCFPTNLNLIDGIVEEIKEEKKDY
jgi:Exopolyphosphatase